MEEKIKENKSMFYQILATVILILELSENKLLKSDFYQNMNWCCGLEYADWVKRILVESGLGNPATFQMLIYALLVVPKELLNDDDDFKKTYKEKFNKLIEQISKDSLKNGYVFEFSTNYNGESEKDLSTINFYRHIRNAIAHSKCKYANRDSQKKCVIFSDTCENKKQKTKYKFSLTIQNEYLQHIIIELLKMLMDKSREPDL